MRCRSIAVSVLIILFAVPVAFGQSEGLKNVVNNLAFYKQKKDIKYLASAKNSVDSLIKATGDSLDVEKNTYKALVYSTILYVDSLNKLNQPASLLAQTAAMVDKLAENRRIDNFEAEMDYSKRCLANVYLRKAFAYMNKSDFNNALLLFENAQKYVPSFKQLDAYIAYSNNKLGNLHAAAKYYTDLIGGDSTKAAYVEAASNIYKSFGDTVTALQIVKKGRKVLPNDRSLLLDEANIYSNKKDYRSLVNLLPALLEINVNNADITFVAASCYDHLHEYDKAEALYLRTIELNSAAFEPVFNLGLLYLKLCELKGEGGGEQDMAQAMQWLQKANEILPNDINCLQALQLAYAQTGNKDEVKRINNKLKQLTNQ